MLSYDIPPKVVSKRLHIIQSVLYKGCW